MQAINFLVYVLLEPFFWYLQTKATQTGKVLKILIFILDRKKESTYVGVGERAERGREPQSDSVLSMEPNAGLNFMTLRS